VLTLVVGKMESSRLSYPDQVGLLTLTDANAHRNACACLRPCAWSWTHAGALLATCTVRCLLGFA
jgi:hypothetical protein